MARHAPDCDCSAEQPKSDYDANIPAVADAARAMLAALEECVTLMHADNPADGWKDAIDAGRSAIAQAKAAGITP